LTVAAAAAAINEWRDISV